MKVCLVASPGGHLTQLLYLAKGLSSHETFIVTYRDGRTAEMKGAYLFPNIWKEPASMLSMLPRMLAVFIKERPRLVVSTGSEIAIPMFLLARLIGAKTMFVESLARSSTRSGTGRAVYPLSSVFLVQWPKLLALYGKRARYWGSLL